MGFGEAGSPYRVVANESDDPSKQFGVDLFCAARRLVEIHRRIELEQPEHESFGGIYRLGPEHERLHLSH